MVYSIFVINNRELNNHPVMVLNFLQEKELQNKVLNYSKYLDDDATFYIVSEHSLSDEEIEDVLEKIDLEYEDIFYGHL
jgi:hypothetical protein